jgi:predicted SnoaL-like aldol condensation-catalyzing enzyme
MPDSLLTVQSLYADFAQGNLSKILATLDPKAIIHQPDSLPYGGTHKGRDGFISLMKTLYATWPGLQVDLESTIASDNTVVVRGEWVAKATNAKEAMHMPFVHIWKMNNSLIIEIWFYDWDTARMLNYLSAPTL